MAAQQQVDLIDLVQGDAAVSAERSWRPGERAAAPSRETALQWSRRPLKWPVLPPIEMLTPPLGWSQLPKALLMLTVPVW